MLRDRRRVRAATSWRTMSAALVVCVAAVCSLDLGSAAFTTQTDSVGNSIGSGSVVQPAVAATMTLNVTPLLTCKVVLTWAASSTPGVTDYEVVRVVKATSAVSAGPWTVTGLTYTDNPVPLQLTGNQYEWRVRAVLGTWTSGWIAGTADNVLACLL